MIQPLQRKFGLVALKLSLRPRAAGMAARAELVAFEQGAWHALGDDWWLDVGELGLSKRLGADWTPPSSLPSPFVSALKERLARHRLPPGDPLWIHLAKPYGLLGMLPWEDWLGRLLGRPLLRLPQYLEPPCKNRDVLELALCCSSLAAKPPLVTRIVHRILEGSGRGRTAVHIFAPHADADELRSLLAHEARVSVHGPADFLADATPKPNSAKPNSESRASPGTLRNRWLQWMLGAMQGRSLDAAYFVCQGAMVGERGTLVLPESTLNPASDGHADFIGVAELAHFLTQAGAWSAVFADTDAGRFPSGLRHLADALAHARPGAVLYHPLADGDASVVQGLCAFLYGAGRNGPPESGGWFACCSPERVSQVSPVSLPGAAGSRILDAYADLLTGQVGRPAESARDFDVWVGGVSPLPPAALQTAPSWVAAAQRFVESQVAIRQQLYAQASRVKSARQKQAEATLQRLQSIISSVARHDGPEPVKSLPP